MHVVLVVSDPDDRGPGEHQHGHRGVARRAQVELQDQGPPGEHRHEREAEPAVHLDAEGRHRVPHVIQAVVRQAAQHRGGAKLHGDLAVEVEGLPTFPQQHQQLHVGLHLSPREGRVRAPRFGGVVQELVHREAHRLPDLLRRRAPLRLALGPGPGVAGPALRRPRQRPRPRHERLLRLVGRGGRLEKGHAQRLALQRPLGGRRAVVGPAMQERDPEGLADVPLEGRGVRRRRLDVLGRRQWDANHTHQNLGHQGLRHHQPVHREPDGRQQPKGASEHHHGEQQTDLSFLEVHELVLGVRAVEVVIDRDDEAKLQRVHDQVTLDLPRGQGAQVPHVLAEEAESAN
mmetsp:Transcript_86017/g.263223  ORF Transcript_86017/g.263223 Transcript_86017/m.263223 type:complete len:345 (-) Transcript_86017:166-1200(-)